MVEHALICVSMELACLELRQPGTDGSQHVHSLAAALTFLEQQAAGGAKVPASMKPRPATYILLADDGSACAAAPPFLPQPAGHDGMRVSSPEPEGVGMQAAVAALTGGAGAAAQHATLVKLQMAAAGDEAGWADDWCQRGAVEVPHLFTCVPGV